ncbi:uncharacterized protein LOC127712065 [Mytilus californianus]|uniref:uncharacterized protein LOC127712065 n=1 Tax=Mytilus californianus TaxID=6549 RepID=UPI002246ECD9|nr:uncharacterized protein LOC127712065 [Mytilus californianus]
MAKTIMNIMFLANMLIVLSKIQFSLQLSGGVCKSKDKGEDVCCYNYENINDVCTQCIIGTVSLQDGLCFPCRENKYGYKCLNDCKCDHSQRCDAKIGCIRMTVTTIDAGNKGTYFQFERNVHI